jgi:MATE family multidrug resistance protein
MASDGHVALRKSRSDPNANQWRRADGHEDENTPLLEPVTARNSVSRVDDIDEGWDDAVLKGLITTTWQREDKTLARNSAPLILTFVLQYSLTVASIFTVGHIGKVELGAVSLAHSTSKFLEPSLLSSPSTHLALFPPY